MRTMKEKAKPHPLRLTKSSDTPPDCLLFHPATNKGSGGVDMALCLPSGSAGCGGKCAESLCTPSLWAQPLTRIQLAPAHLQNLESLPGEEQIASLSQVRE